MSWTNEMAWHRPKKRIRTGFVANVRVWSHDIQQKRRNPLRNFPTPTGRRYKSNNSVHRVCAHRVLRVYASPTFSRTWRGYSEISANRIGRGAPHSPPPPTSSFHPTSPPSTQCLPCRVRSPENPARKTNTTLVVILKRMRINGKRTLGGITQIDTHIPIRTLGTFNLRNAHEMIFVPMPNRITHVKLAVMICHLRRPIVVSQGRVKPKQRIGGKLPAVEIWRIGGP